MRELSLNILDIVENSVKAGASLVEVGITADGNMLTITIDDDGAGMDKEFLERVEDPFTTTRTTRKVGMGIPLFKMAAEMAGGEFEITSEKGVGTKVRATFEIDNIDREPLGNIADTVVTLLSDEKPTDFLFTFNVDGEWFDFDTRELKEKLGEIPISTPDVLIFVRDMINENINSIGGANL